MANSKFDNVWQLLLKYNFTKEIPEEFHCSICRNVSIEPFTALCECRFCSVCIKEYLKNGKKYCIGEKKECKEDYLELNVNVSKDLKAVRCIGRFFVKCPNNLCNIKCELETMGDHLRVCGMSTMKCPYESMGCQVSPMSKDNLKIHYDNEWFSHTQFLVELIDNVRNDVDGLRNMMEKKDEDYGRKEIMIVEMKQQIDEQRKDIEILKDKDNRRETELEVMKEDFRIKELHKKTIMEEMDNLNKENTQMNITILELKEKVNEHSKEIDLLKNKNGMRENELDMTQEDLKMKETQMKIMVLQLENLKKDITEMNVRESMEGQMKRLNDLRKSQKSIEKELSSVIMTMRNSQIYDEREFIWRVDNFSLMTDNDRSRRVILWRYSYKFYLFLWCEDYLKFGCRIMMGEFDEDTNNLIWPMKHKITMSLINQKTMKAHKYCEYCCDTYKTKSAFDKPAAALNTYYFGDDSFMTVKDIMNSAELLLNDSLIVSLNIDIK